MSPYSKVHERWVHIDGKSSPDTQLQQEKEGDSAPATACWTLQTQTPFPQACKADHPQCWWVNQWQKSQPNTWSCHRCDQVQCLPSWCPTGSTVRTNKRNFFPFVPRAITLETIPTDCYLSVTLCCSAWNVVDGNILVTTKVEICSQIVIWSTKSVSGAQPPLIIMSKTKELPVWKNHQKFNTIW